MRRIPATIVTGFLGAGKTSLVRHLIGAAAGHRLAIIVNEFGELGIDRELLLGCGDAACTEDDIVELANGCICCTVAEDFLPTLAQLLDRAAPPEHILIETSGLALPKPLVQAFAWPEIRARTTVDGVLTVIDGAAVADGRFADDPQAVTRQRAADPMLTHDNPLEEVFTDQLACADLAILNKADLIGPARLSALCSEIEARLRPGVKLVTAREGRVPPEVVLGLGAAAEDDLADRLSLHDLEAEHDHDEARLTLLTDLPGPIEVVLYPIADGLDDLAAVAPGPVDKALDPEHLVKLDRGAQAGEERRIITHWSRGHDKALEIVVIMLGFEVV